MPYATIEDVSVLTGTPYFGAEADYLEEWLDTIDIIIDDLITSYNVDPDTIQLRRKKKVAANMGAIAAQVYQIDPTVTSMSVTSGDTSESESRQVSGALHNRIVRIDPFYLKILGLKPVFVGSADIINSWGHSHHTSPYWRR